MQRPPRVELNLVCAPAPSTLKNGAGRITQLSRRKPRAALLEVPLAPHVARTAWPELNLAMGPQLAREASSTAAVSEVCPREAAVDANYCTACAEAESLARVEDRISSSPPHRNSTSHM